MHKNLINKKALQFIIAHSNICRHAKAEFKRAGYGKGKGGPNEWMYKQVMESVAVFASHGNSGSSAPFEINLVQKLCNWDVINPLKFTDDEWRQISEDGTCQNIRKVDVFKEPNGDIHYNGAYRKRPTKRYSYNTKEWTDNKHPVCWNGGLFEFKNGVCWNGGLFEHSNGILTGRYFNRCLLYLHDVDKGWMPKETKILDCVEVEIASDNWIMAVQEDSIDLLNLACSYKIDWKECSCLKDVHLEDVTPELEEQAYSEIQKGFDVK